MQESSRLFDFVPVWLIAGGGALLALWGHVRAVISRMVTWGFVRTQVEGRLGSLVMNYLARDYHRYNSADRVYAMHHYYVRSEKRWRDVLIRILGMNLVVYRKGLRFIFAGSPATRQSDSGSGGGTGDKVVFRYIRGTVPMERIMQACVERYADWNLNRQSQGRFYVCKVFGNEAPGIVEGGDSVSQEGGSAFSPGGIFMEDGLPPLMTGFRMPIGFDREDLGVDLTSSGVDQLALSDDQQAVVRRTEVWRNNKQWFQDRGVTWRLSFLFHGPAGTGKSSMARSLGRHFDMPVFSVDLSSLSNRELYLHWSNVRSASPAILLLEDIDSVFHGRKFVGPRNQHKNPLTFDCLLNCIDGVEQSDGILLIVTTNNLDKLDPALGVPDSEGKSTRPGRLGWTVYFGGVDRKRRSKIARRIMAGMPEEDIQAMIDSVDDSITPDMFCTRCEDAAEAYFWQQRSNGDKNHAENVEVSGLR